MFDDFIGFLLARDSDGYDQAQREAILDAVILVMHADRIVRLTENDQLARVVDALGWDNPLDPTQYIGEATSRVRAALAGDRLADFANSIAGRVGDQGVRRQLYLLADAMANADAEVDEREAAVLEALVTAFSDRGS